MIKSRVGRRIGKEINKRGTRARISRTGRL
jgi:hypothetical protein